MFTDLLTMVFPAGGWAVKLGKWLLSKLTLRNIAILIALIAIAYGQYRFYGWAQARQYDEDKVVIDKVSGERDAINTKYQTYRTAFKTWVKRSELARLTLEKENKAYVAETEKRLKAEEARSAKLRKDLKDAIAKQIPAAVDYDLPRGFVRLWAQSFEGEPGYVAPIDGTVPYGLGNDAGRASGLKLSGFSVYGIDNNQECVIRGQVIREWHAWYYKHKDLWEKSQKQVIDAIPQVPGDAK